MVQGIVQNPKEAMRLTQKAGGNLIGTTARYYPSRENEVIGKKDWKNTKKWF